MTEGKSYDFRSILEEMRQEYWQGLAEATEVQEDLVECLVFSLGGELYAFETSYATEVIRVPKLVKVPGAQELIEGIFNLRGEITAAMDIRPLLGLPRAGLTPLARIIVVKGGRFTTGILTEGVHGVTALPLGQFEPVARSVEAGTREYLRGQVKLDGQMVMLLDIARLLESPVVVVDQA
jgi:purine-binding chemotaxis protein CheW